MQLINAGLVEPLTEQSCRAMGGGRFYKSYASLERLDGTCRLMVLWKKGGHQREFEMHSFLLRFSHEGVSRYRTETIRGSGREPGLDVDPAEYVPVTLPEAAALLQDAYRQNLRFNTRPAGGIRRSFFLLEYDTGGVDRPGLLDKLSGMRLTPGMFVHVYLAAFRRMDNAVLYDYSSKQRTDRLGPREDFLLDFGEEYRNYTFLKTGISGPETGEGTGCFKTFAVVVTPREELLKITFDLRLRISGERLLVDHFEEESRRSVAADDPENPFNYPIFCSFYRVSGPETIKRWLDSDPQFFLCGEQHEFLSYKRLSGPEDSVYRGFDITDRVDCELILGRDEMVVYAKRPQNLLQFEKMAAMKACGAFRLCSKYSLPVRLLHEKINRLGGQGPGGKSIFGWRSGWRKYRAVSALVHLDAGPVLWSELFWQQAKIKIELPEGTWYFWGPEGQQVSMACEAYQSGNWLVLYAYGDKSSDWLESLREILPSESVVYDYEIENYYDLFNPPLNEQKKWLIYGMVQRFSREKRLLAQLSFLPSLKEVAKKMGGVVMTAR